MRKTILLPAVALAASLFLVETAQAQPPLGPMPPRPGPGPGSILRPPPFPPIDFRPAPRIGIGISIGAPIPSYPIHRPPIVIVDPVCEYYRVIYRDCAHDPWQTYRVYESHRVAHRVADQLRDMGYQARVLHD